MLYSRFSLVIYSSIVSIIYIYIYIYINSNLPIPPQSALDSHTFVLYVCVSTSALQMRVCMLSCSVVSDSLQPHGLSPTKLLCPWNFSGQNAGSRLPLSPPRDLPNPRIELVSSMLAGGFFTIDSCGKPCFANNISYTIFRYSTYMH